ncbi:unnamed protein product [Linum trigynum]|uniref:Uncharacterized protein n=1 Tax=Linum trigynum TaxID=586398 RepID=A0AAV2CJF3_9ROSI
MELRSFNHFHYINAIKDGKVTRVPNVYRGKPALKFRNLQDVYRDLKNAPNSPMFEGSEPKAERESGASSKGNSREAVEEDKNEEDLDFCCLTLKQLRGRCMAKNESVPAKNHPLEVACQEPRKMIVILWSASAVGDDESPRHADSSVSSDIHVKDEVPESDHGDCQAIVLSDWVEPVAPFGLPSDDEEPDLSSECEFEIPEAGHVDCQAIVVFNLLDSSSGRVEPLASFGSSFDREPGSSFGCDVETGLSIVSPPELLELKNHDSQTEESETARTFNDINNELQCCSVEIDLQIEELEDGLENCHPSNASLSMLEEDVMVVDSHPIGKLDKVVSSSKDHCSIVHDDSKEELQNASPTAIKVEITTKDSTECMVVDSCRFEGEDKNEKPQATVDSFPNAVSNDKGQILHPTSSQDRCSSSTDVVVQSPLSPAMKPGSGQPVELVACEDSDTSDQRQHPPERLLSARKAISPTSQEKLRKAMESNELDDEQLYNKKLCYGKKQPERTNSRPDAVNQAKRAAENTVSSQHLMRKLKNPKPISPPPNDVPRTISRPVRAPSFSTRCNSIQSCSENAISFSQNHMRDLESMATKLTKELKSMKDIAEAALHFNPSASPKYTHQEASSTIEKAARVEENVRRWLSTMARDCDRFCKLMKLTQNGPATTSAAIVVAQKEKRNISFTNEAGGKLCHVKTFKSEVEFMEPINLDD